MTGPPNLAENGDFETGTFAHWFYGGVAQDVMAYEYYFTNRYGDRTYDSARGSYVARFANPLPVWLTQSISLPTAPCNLTFWLGGSGPSLSDYFVAGIDQQVLASWDGSVNVNNWQSYTTVFNGEGRKKTLFFSCTNQNDYWYLDTISVTCSQPTS